MLRPPEPDVRLEARATTRKAARTFALASRLLPRSVRDDVYLLYMVFRTLDDLVDEDMPEALPRIAAVESWCRGGPPRTRETEVLAGLATRHPLPRAALLEFCAGMRSDIERRPIESEQDLDRYCFQAAGTVGIVMAAVLRVREPGAERQAAALGMAMQRTNILRDIDEDRQAGRRYVPREAVERHGEPEPGRREALVRDHIARAEALYRDGIDGIPKLARGRAAIAAAAAMYREILRQIAREGYGARPGRAVVPAWRKAAVAAPQVIHWWTIGRRPGRRARGRPGATTRGADVPAMGRDHRGLQAQ